MNNVKAYDFADLYYKDWGEGPAVMFLHSWLTNADAWDIPMFFLARHGYRVIAYDRRGHGRSAQASKHNDMDGYADDLAAVIEALDLHDVVLVGHSTGAGEIARYICKNGTSRVAKTVLISAALPVILQSPANPDGLPIQVFDELRIGLLKDRSQFYKDLAVRFTGADRPGTNISQSMLDQFWLWGMQVGLLNAYESIKAFSETDFTEDLKSFDIPTLFLHGEDDQLIPIESSSRKAARLIPGATEIYYPGAPHAMVATHFDRINTDLLNFLRS